MPDGQDQTLIGLFPVDGANPREIVGALARADDVPRFLGMSDLRRLDIGQCRVIGLLLAAGGKAQGKQDRARYPRRHGFRRWLQGA